MLAERLELLLRLDVAVKIHHAADMKLPQHGLAIVIDIRAVDTNHDHLADFFIRRHLGYDRVGLFLKRLRLCRGCALFCRRRLAAAASHHTHGQQPCTEHRGGQPAPSFYFLHPLCLLLPHSTRELTCFASV